LIYSGGGAIALDNVVGQIGSCPNSQVCDFESGQCGWTTNNNSGNPFVFKLIQASNALWDSLKYDHTTETEFGHFMEASNGNLEIINSILKI
jgi:hypothetical protein